ncbi:MAG TPA: SulP family inorganic anion transporter [Gemmataceae bacterium]|nr:SulP family inorganic anion transporter [Gemmataceae bacterium]
MLNLHLTERLAAYGRSGLRRDLIAGLTVAAVALPQAMAYAQIAGIPPVYGLYTAVVMTAVASLLGSSSHLINGPTNAISLVVFSAIAGLALDPHGPQNPDERLQAVFLLCLMVGVFQVVIALLKMGDLTRYISESVVLGFMAGAGLLVALGQVPNLLGVKQQGADDQLLVVRLWATLTALGPGKAIKWTSVALGAGTAVVVILLRRLEKRLKVLLPDMLIGVVLAALVAWQFGLTDADMQVQLVYHPMHVGDWAWVRGLSGSALAIALLGLLEALAVAKSIASRTRQRIDFNRQCLAEGLANVAGSLCNCMPGSGSLTRSAINHQAGAVSRFSGIIAAAAVAVAVAVFAGLARYVPKAALAGLLVVTAFRLVDWKRLGYCLRATRFDAGVCLITVGAAIAFPVEYSILIGTFFSFLFFVPRAARLQASELVVSRERVVREKQPGDPECTKMVLLNLEGELFFGAAPELDDFLADLRRRIEQGARVVILRLKRVRNPDMVCLERLQHFLEDAAIHKATVLLCGVRPDFAQILENLHFHRWLPRDRVFLEEAMVMSSTLQAVRRAYEILGDDVCPTCPRRGEASPDKADWYYMI